MAVDRPRCRFYALPTNNLRPDLTSRPSGGSLGHDRPTDMADKGDPRFLSAAAGALSAYFIFRHFSTPGWRPS